MTPELFVAKWSANTRNEAAASKEHFLDLCALLDVPTPNSDATGATYAFEKGATKASGGAGWADVWRRGCFGWEYKSRGGNLETAHDQLLRYAGALENPPLLICSDMERIIVRTNWTNEVSARHVFALEEILAPGVRARLRTCWTEPDAWKSGTTRQALTEKAAGTFAELARRLRERGHDPHRVAHFMIRLVFCLFADDVDLLPAGLFDSMLAQAAKRPVKFADFASELFRAMKDRDGRIGFQAVPWFNGGLFDDDAALPLQAADITDLAQAAALDWSEIDPAIMGTLFERGLNPDKRSQFGAHYTSREMIERIVEPVVRRPLLEAWGRMKPGIEVALQKAAGAKGRAAKGFRAQAETALRGFLDRLRGCRVLDPACGSGNFLYLALLALKDIEHQVSVEAEALGLQREFAQVGPETVMGIELDPYAAELARVSVWIGHIQWARRHGFPPPSDPVLKPLDNIECRDALLDADGAVAEWPVADVIIGNPPFLGGKRMRTVLGDSYTERIFAAYAGRVPAEADLVCYWFARAQAQIADGQAARAGLVATNSIRGGVNRRVLEPAADAGAIIAAWPDEPWILDGAAVRVSLICWGRERSAAPFLNDVAVSAIHADLTAGSLNITTAKTLVENKSVSFQGSKKVGPFEIPGEVARRWLVMPSNANGKLNSEVLRLSWIGIDVARRLRDEWIVDFTGLSQKEAAFFSAPYSHVLQNVKPLRDKNARVSRRLNWWLHGDLQPKMRAAIRRLNRYIVTPEVSRHRIFVWAPRLVLPDCKLMVIAKDDDMTFGVLQSRFHEIWSLASGSWHGAGNDPRYTPSTTFETFPFPDGLTPNVSPAVYEHDARAGVIAEKARELVAAREKWLNPPELVDVVPEVVAGFPDRILPKDEAAAAVLKTRTLTALYNMRGTPAGTWLDNLHAELDAAVAAAYGWAADIAVEDALGRLLALNHARGAA